MLLESTDFLDPDNIFLSLSPIWFPSISGIKENIKQKLHSIAKVLLYLQIVVFHTKDKNMF